MRFLLWKGGNSMKRMLCLLLVMVLMLSMCVQAFADDDVLYCRMCGKRIPTDSKVCPYCGEKVVHVEDDKKAEENNTKPGAEEMPKTAETPAAPAAASSTPAAASSAPAAASSAPTAAQSDASSPATAATPVPGPFHTTIGANNTLQGHVYVTKSPTSESVPYGGSCMFIAHAANATSVTWYIANSDASLITTVAEAPNRVSGLSVSGANSDTLVLYGIPSYMNGCQVQACFNGEGGPVYSDIARIWTYQPAPQPKNCGWSFWDWVNYYYWDDPGIPWWYWYDLYDDRPNPPDVGRRLILSDGSSIAPEKPGPGFIYDGEEAVVVGHKHTPGSTSSTAGSKSTGQTQAPPPPIIITGGNTQSGNGGTLGKIGS